MELVNWLYAHETLAVFILGTAGGFALWMMGVYWQLKQIASTLGLIRKELKAHDGKLDNHEIRITVLETHHAQWNGEKDVGVA